MTESTNNNRTSLLLLAGCCALPSFQTLVSVYWEWQTLISYPVLKGLMLILPVIVWLRLRRRGVDIRQRTGLKKTNLRLGLFMGAAMGGAVLVAYYAVLRPMIDPAPLLQKLESLGMIEYYWIMAIFISLLNSLLEEYYWRAFIVGELHTWLGSTWSVCIVAGLLFGGHHVFALLPVVEWPVLLLGVAGTMIAGGTWAWMRARGSSIFDCYVSHVLADLAAMWCGYDLLSRAGA